MASPRWGTSSPVIDTMSLSAPRPVEQRLDEMNQLLWDFVGGRTPLTASDVFDRVHDFAADESCLHAYDRGAEPDQVLAILEAFADAASAVYAGQHGISSATLTLNYLGLVRHLAFENPGLEVSDRWRCDVDRLSRAADDPDLTIDGLVVLMSYGGV